MAYNSLDIISYYPQQKDTHAFKTIITEKIDKNKPESKDQKVPCLDNSIIKQCYFHKKQNMSKKINNYIIILLWIEQLLGNKDLINK